MKHKTATKSPGARGERAKARSQQRVVSRLIACLPTNWCDPMLTGPSAVLSPRRNGAWNCVDIERLIWAIKHRMEKAANDRLQ